MIFKPVTREEKLLSGHDVKPITREEMFIRGLWDDNQAIPEPITREEYFLKKVGEVIREKLSGADADG